MRIKIINTGGTFNKVYNELTGELDIDTQNDSLKQIIKHARGNIDFTIKGIIYKDSLEFTDEDRTELARTIHEAECEKIIVIHGTDTMDASADALQIYLNKNGYKNKKIIFTGAMKPYFIERDEAIFNVAAALGFLASNPSTGIYVSMHALVLEHSKIKKDKAIGLFKRVEA